MTIQNKNSHTEQTKIKSKKVFTIFPHYIGEYKLDFAERDIVYNLLLRLKDKHKDNAISQKADEMQVKGDTYTIGGFQMNMFDNYGVNNFTDLTQEHGLSIEEESAIKKISNTFRIVANDFADHYPKDYFNNDLKMYYKNWFVMYNKNSFQEIHTHGTGNLFTIVYFLKLPEKMQYVGSKPDRLEGSLVITDNSQDYWGTRIDYIKPEEDKLVIFSGKYPHYTLPLVSEGWRCVIVNDFYMQNE